jgi:hypothetical protein
LNPINLLFSPLRVRIPFLLDVLIVSDADQIQKIEGSRCGLLTVPGANPSQ